MSVSRICRVRKADVVLEQVMGQGRRDSLKPSATISTNCAFICVAPDCDEVTAIANAVVHLHKIITGLRI